MKNDRKIITALGECLPQIIAIYRFGSAGTEWERFESTARLNEENMKTQKK